MFFWLTKGRQLSSGNDLYGFIGDATQTNYVPHLATGAWGQVNGRQLRTIGALNNTYGQPLTFAAPVPVTQSAQLETFGLIDNPNS